MKKPLFLAMLIIFSIQTYSQTNSGNPYGRAYYGKSIELTTERDAQLSDLDKFIMEATENALFILDFNKEASLFQIEKKLEIDGRNTRGAETLYGGGKGLYYSNQPENYTVHQRDFGGELYLIEGEFTSVEWKLLKESKKIQNYTCYKAIGVVKFLSSKTGEITLREVEAWYSPEVPIPFGPIGYNNLPGLIFELRDRNALYYIKRIEFNTKNKTEILKPKKGVKVSETAFEYLGKNMFEERKQQK